MLQNRYNKQIKLAGFGEKSQQKLQHSKVLVVGAGGLGVPVLQYLTGMGVGTIGVIDGDTVNLDNLHRQVLYNEDDINKLKAEVAVPKLSLLNSKVQLNAHAHFLTTDNALKIINGYDIVIDCSDNFGTRYLINDACVILHKPFIYGAVQQYEGHVSVFNYRGGATYRCLYPNPPAANEIPDCNNAGVLGIAPGIIGCQQALQTIKVITGVGANLSGFLQVFDLLNDETYKIRLHAKAENKNITALKAHYATPICNPDKSISVKALYRLYKDNEQFLLLDVREPKEFAAEHLEFARLFPLSTLRENMTGLPVNTRLITICEIGGRSARAAVLIGEALPGVMVSNVKGGMEAWFDELGEELIVYSEKQVAQ